jgi:hypothetical protein
LVDEKGEVLSVEPENVMGTKHETDLFRAFVANGGWNHAVFRRAEKGERSHQ